MFISNNYKFAGNVSVNIQMVHLTLILNVATFIGSFDCRTFVYALILLNLLEDKL